MAATLAAVAMLGCSDEDGGSLNPTAPSAVNAPATASSASAGATFASTGAEAASSGDQITIDGSMTSTRGLNAARTGGVLTANILSPADHDGTSFVVELHFSEPIVAEKNSHLRYNAFSVTGGSITKVRRLNRQARQNGGWRASQWKLWVEPSGSGDVVLEAPGGRSCTEIGSFCTEADQSLSHALGATIRGTSIGQQQGGSGGDLTATLQFDVFPSWSPFVGVLLFSEPIVDSYHDVRDNAFSVAGGSITKAQRLYGHSSQWEITVEPSGLNDVILTAVGGRSCSEKGALCTRDGRSLASSLTATATATTPSEPPPSLLPGPVGDLRAVWRSAGNYSVSFSAPGKGTAYPLTYQILVGGCVGGARRITVTGSGGSFTRQVSAGHGTDTLPKFGAEATNTHGTGPCVEVQAVRLKADLVVVSPRARTSLETGESFTLAANVQNVGDGTFVGKPTLRFYLSTDNNITTSDTEVGDVVVYGVERAGARKDGRISLTAPSTAGTYYYGACAATSSSESNRNNNCSTGLQIVVTN